MLTGKIPDWGLHRDECRLGTHRVDVQVPVESVMDWGMLGYFVGDVVQEHIPVVVGIVRRARDRPPEALRRGGVLVRRRRDVSHRRHHAGRPSPSRWRLDGNRPVERFTYGEAERRQVYDRLNANASDPNVDYVMLGCPHAALEQLREAAALLDGQRVSGNCNLWIFTSRAVRQRSATARIREGDQRCRRRGADRHVFGVRAGDSSGHESGGARFGEAGALSAGDSRRAGVVRLDARLHPGGRHRPLERRAAMTVSATIVLRGRGVVGGRAEGEALVTREDDSRLGRRQPATRRHHRNAPRAARQELQRQGARFSWRQGIVGLVGDVSHGTSGGRGTKGAHLQ